MAIIYFAYPTALFRRRPIAAAIPLAAALALLTGGAGTAAAESPASGSTLQETTAQLPSLVQKTTEAVEQAAGAALSPPSTAPPPPPPVSVPHVAVPRVPPSSSSPPAQPAPTETSPSPAPAPEAAGGEPQEEPGAGTAPAGESPGYAPDYEPDHAPQYAPATGAASPPSGGERWRRPHSPTALHPRRALDTTAAPTFLRPGPSSSLLATVGRGPGSLPASLGAVGEAALRAIAGVAGPGPVAIALAASHPVGDDESPGVPLFGPWLGGEPPLPAALFYLLLALGALAVWVALRRQLGRPLVSRRWRH